MATREMERYCAGDAAGFQRMYSLLAPRLLVYIRRLIDERTTAEDVLQQTFLKVHKHRAAYVRGANPIPWLYAIAHRTSLDELRKRKRLTMRLVFDDELASLPHSAPPALAEGEFPESTLPAVAAALHQLPAAQRNALVWTTLGGRTHSEAARMAGSTRGAIKLRVHRAYVSLRKILIKHA